MVRVEGSLKIHYLLLLVVCTDPCTTHVCSRSESHTAMGLLPNNGLCPTSPGGSSSRLFSTSKTSINASSQVWVVRQMNPPFGQGVLGRVHLSSPPIIPSGKVFSVPSTSDRSLLSLYYLIRIDSPEERSSSFLHEPSSPSR